MIKIGKKAFTLAETIMVIAVIGILMAGMTMYLSSQGDRAKLIEAESCANIFNGQINNQVFYALTSKIINSGNRTYSPDFYLIEFSGGNTTDGQNCTSNNTGIFCDKLIFRYGSLSGTNEIVVSGDFDQTITNRQCKMGETKLAFIRSGSNIKYIRMNKGFSPILGIENAFFGISSDNTISPTDQLMGEIIVRACFNQKDNNECNLWREIGKWIVDARSQTIGYKKCRFYYEDLNTCEEREA